MFMCYSFKGSSSHCLAAEFSYVPFSFIELAMEMPFQADVQGEGKNPK